MNVWSLGGNDFDNQRTTIIIIIVVCVVVTLLVVVVTVTVVICVKHHHKLTTSKPYTISDNQLQYLLLTDVSHLDESALNTTPSSIATYIPISDDNPRLQDTPHVDHDRRDSAI